MIAFFLKILYSLYFKTIRLELIHNEASPSQLPPDVNAIYVFWHSKTFLLLPLYHNFNIGVLTLLDWKNTVYDGLCRLYGYQTVRVISFQTAAVELKNLLDGGSHIALALDGPGGPAGTFKRGALHLSRTTGKPLIAVNIRCKKSIRLRSRWDRYEIPWPFSTATISSTQPMHVSDDNLEIVEQRIKEFLKDI